MHLLRGSFEKAATSYIESHQHHNSSRTNGNLIGPSLTTMEQCISREHDFFITILHEPTDAVLSVAGSVVGLHGDVLSNFEATAIWCCLIDCLTVPTADNLLACKLIVLKLPLIRY